jgi:hypothetical protein
LYQPVDVCVDATGNVLFSEGDHRLRKVNTSGIISTLAGRSAVIGSSGDGGPATAALLSSPGGIVVNSSGNVFVADVGNAKIRKLSAGTNDVVTPSIYSNSSLSFSAYPNPVVDFVTLELKQNTNASVTILNVLGNVLFDAPVNETRTTIDCRTYPPGQYYVLVTSGNEKRSVVITKQ